MAALLLLYSCKGFSLQLYSYSAAIGWFMAAWRLDRNPAPKRAPAGTGTISCARTVLVGSSLDLVHSSLCTPTCCATYSTCDTFVPLKQAVPWYRYGLQLYEYE